MYFTSGSDRSFEQLMQDKSGLDHYDSDEGENDFTPFKNIMNDNTV